MKIYILFILFGITSIIISNTSSDSGKTMNTKSNFSSELIIAELLKSDNKNIEILGNPITEESPYGNAVYFDGKKDAIILNDCPILGFSKFTIEVIFKPASGGAREQRFLHFGEVKDERALLETRVPNDSVWYLDAFLQTSKSKLTLIDSNLTHTLNQWHHLAFVIDNGKLGTFVDGKKELEGNVEMQPLKTGKTSIGVRQNLVYWFKGAIYKIKITDKVLRPEDFLKLK